MLLSSFPAEIILEWLEIDTALKSDLSSQLSRPGREKRAREFEAGRRAAACALSRLGHKVHEPLARGTDGAPAWPQGFVGSISHSHKRVVAAVARKECFASIGIDLQHLRPILDAHALAERICTNRELEQIFARELPLETCLLGIFSAKEAIYKAFSKFSYKRLLFKDAELSFGDSLTNTPIIARVYGFKESVQVYQSQTEEFILSGVFLEHLPRSKQLAS